MVKVVQNTQPLAQIKIKQNPLKVLKVSASNEGRNQVCIWLHKHIIILTYISTLFTVIALIKIGLLSFKFLYIHCNAMLVKHSII